MIRRVGFGSSAHIASRLRERITIEEPVDTPDGQGGVSRSWDAVASCFAEVTPLGGTERFDAGKVGERVSYRIVVRARTDVTVAMRVVWQSHVLNIRSAVVIDGRLEIMAEEGVAV
jgi:SPP1 family predicted phage head-tail adaptor